MTDRKRLRKAHRRRYRTEALAANPEAVTLSFKAWLRHTGVTRVGQLASGEHLFTIGEQHDHGAFATA